MGVAGLDYILGVEKYPAADEKIRTVMYKVVGGGNVANTLTAVSRLGIQSSLFSIIGRDSSGDQILQELAKDSVDTKWCVITDESPSAVTHVVVDSETSSRTCIHAAMSVEISEDEVAQKWDAFASRCEPKSAISLIHFDSRQTLAAVALARKANEAGVPVSVDLEKFRPHLQDLIPLCDLVFTNKHFPRIYCNSTESIR